MPIAIDDLTFSYSRLPVLQGICASAAAGTITALIGPNAAGKSTLLRCIIGALRPQSGVTLIDGKPVQSFSIKALARRIAYVPQRSIVSAAFTVRQVVALGRFALPTNTARVDQAIQRLDLSDVADRRYQALSVGQQQRVTLARSLAQLEPDGHLILDEPTSAMDLRHIASCMLLLREVARGGATVVLAMHDLALAALVADSIWLLDSGQLVAAGEMEQVMTIERLENVFDVGFEWIAAADGRPRLLAHAPA